MRFSNDNTLVSAAARFGLSIGRAERLSEALRSKLEEIKDYHDNGQVHPKSLIIDVLDIAGQLRDTTYASVAFMDELKKEAERSHEVTS